MEVDILCFLLKSVLASVRTWRILVASSCKCIYLELTFGEKLSFSSRRRPAPAKFLLENDPVTDGQTSEQYHCILTGDVIIDILKTFSASKDRVGMLGFLIKKNQCNSDATRSRATPSVQGH